MIKTFELFESNLTDGVRYAMLNALKQTGGDYEDAFLYMEEGLRASEAKQVEKFFAWLQSESRNVGSGNIDDAWTEFSKLPKQKLDNLKLKPKPRATGVKAADVLEKDKSVMIDTRTNGIIDGTITSYDDATCLLTVRVRKNQWFK